MHTGSFLSSPYSGPQAGLYSAGSPFGGQLASTQWLQIVPQQIQQLQQLAYIQQQQLQQVLQIVPSQLQQIQQLIQLVPHQVQQLVLQLVAQQQFGAFGHVPQSLGVPFQAASPFSAPFAGTPGQVM